MRIYPTRNLKYLKLVFHYIHCMDLYMYVSLLRLAVSDSRLCIYACRIWIRKHLRVNCSREIIYEIGLVT